MLQIQAGEGDLSRRQAMYEMRGLSFREYLEYEGIHTMKPLTLARVLSEHVGEAMAICGKVKIMPKVQTTSHVPIRYTSTILR